MNYGLIGETLGHSYSKLLHEFMSPIPYELRELPREELASFLDIKDFLGINVTIPYKELVMPFLDTIDDNAKRIGSVNTVIHRENKLYGFNTDYDGFSYLLEKHQIKVNGSKVIILGSGGTSKTVAMIMKDRQAKELLVVSRSKDSSFISYEQLPLHYDADLIINTTPIGMFPNINQQVIRLEKFEQCQVVIDVIYNPLRTKLLQQAEMLGKQAIGGLEMLVGQAVYAHSLFHDKPVDLSLIDQLYRRLLRQTMNVVLIGMPGCGKTSIAHQLSANLDKSYIDVDQTIIEQQQQSIKDIFLLQGEEVFRSLELQAIRFFGLQSNQVIASGGGIIKNEENILYLKANGILFFIDRDTSLLAIDQERPLSSSIKQNETLYQERYPLYCKYSDFQIKNNQQLIDVVRKLEECYHEIISD